MTKICTRLKKVGFKVILILIALSITLISCQKSDSQFKPGLVGIYYSEPNLTSIKAVTFLTSLEQNWDEAVDFQTGSSGVWDGFIMAPADGEISFYLETDKVAVLEIDNKFETKSDTGLTSLNIKMNKGQVYPIRVTFYNDGPRTDYGFFTVKWNWDNREISPIPADYIKHSQQNLDDLAWLSILDWVPVDRSQFLTVPGKHVIVYHEPGRFGAWPANNGIWNWGDEILVGLFRAYYKENKYHHSVDRTKPSQYVLARSLDGGETWRLEDPDNFVGDGGNLIDLTNEINFTHPDLAIRFTKKDFFISYTRGESWEGPFRYPVLPVGEITARTDYIVNGEKDCLIFLSAKDERVKAVLQDRSFCARTTDGGKSIKFISWMAETDTIRSVMSSTVRMSENHLITAMRRRYDPPLDQKRTLPQNYITVHESLDDGKTWNYLSKVAHTDRGIRNGNPPSMVKLKDGRICVTYGYRDIPYGIRAKISSDKGRTWSKEILLRDDGRKFDIGYTRSVVREDGKIVTVYYYTTEEIKEMHIEATIWDPDEVM
jgi:hypothetical protein